jgi:CDP-diacylglycerol--serine O-phosphatidyltransferase
MTLKKHIPNAITCCNLLCGCLALVQAFDGNLVMASYLVVLGAIFDFFDGFAARLLKVSSAIGKDLDSLTDMVTFGVVPGILMYQMVKQSLNLDKEGFDFFNTYQYFVFFPLIIVIFSALRLAKFNNDTRQTDSFIGVPTPAVAMFVCSIPLIVGWNSDFSFNNYNNFQFILNPFLLCVVSMILSLLLVSEIPLFALKFKHFKWSGNEIRFAFLIISLLLLVTLQFIGIPIIITLYILLSLVSNLFARKES